MTRPFFGWVSDHLWREVTMFGAFVLEGIGILLLLRYAQDPVLFVALSGCVFFAWGEIYSLFAATCAAAAGLALLVLKPVRAPALSTALIPDAMGIPRV